tara:strand:+ start:1176 stop:1445 length:270 start_codon:yes stop_codon:yes gene_type:complete
MILLLKMSTGIIGLLIFSYYYQNEYLPWIDNKFSNPIIRIFLIFTPLLFIVLPYVAAGGTTLIMSGDMTYFEFLKEFLSAWFGIYSDWN